MYLLCLIFMYKDRFEPTPWAKEIFLNSTEKYLSPHVESKK